MAQQIAQAIMGQMPGGAQPPEGVPKKEDNVKQDAVTGNLMREHANGPKARGMVNDATKPN